jgi:serine/threonine-protein kinase
MATTVEASSPRDALPRRFGRYMLFDFVGKGGMAEIYLARATTDLGAVRLCVVKQILPAYSNDPSFAEMLTQEAKLAARLNHAHIVQVFDLGREGDQLFIAMEYVEGLDLNALLRKCSEKSVKMPFEFAVTIVAGVLAGLDYAHRAKGDEGEALGVVHRDVSPSNVLVSFEGEVKLCDFGIAKANTFLRDQGDEPVKGKAGYMSPEHARGEPLDARADVFAAGIVLWELVQGRRMYRPSSDVPLLEQAKRAEIPELVPRGLPDEEALFAIVRRALSVDKEARYPTAVAMQRELEEYARVAKLGVSAIRLGEWMTEQFGEEVVAQRRARERALVAQSMPKMQAAEASSTAANAELAKSPASESEPPAPPSSDGKQPRSSTKPRVTLAKEHPTSSGAMAAFRAGLDSDKLEVPKAEPSAPHSLAGATVDVGPPSDAAPVASQAAPRPKSYRALVVMAAVALLCAIVAWLMYRT